jgi:Lar family restriction alleviation protein
MWNELKPCPFCGSNNIVIYDKSFNSGPYYDIFCRDCQASVRFADESETEESAVNMWNTRIAPERKPMTLDEAIEHCEEVATKNCSECAEEHKQLANWLRTLKYLKENAVMPIHKKQDWLGIANYYGKKQIPLVIEEMAELTQALTKYMRIRQSGQPVRKTMDEVTDGIKEELSDVIVMMIQLQYLFNIDNDTINEIADEKLKRTLKLMEEQK